MTDADELESIKNRMLALLGDAREILRGKSEWQDAKGYWFAHLRTALDHEHDYLGNDQLTMQNTIDSLRNEDGDVDCLDEDDTNDEPHHSGTSR